MPQRDKTARRQGRDRDESNRNKKREPLSSAAAPGT
jgi:hypothetical protein